MTPNKETIPAYYNSCRACKLCNNTLDTARELVVPDSTNVEIRVTCQAIDRINHQLGIMVKMQTPENTGRTIYQAGEEGECPGKRYG
jgi:hypothetical protein